MACESVKAWFSCFAWMAAALAICLGPAAADILQLVAANQRVAVTAFDRLTIQYKDGCSGSETRTVPWKDVLSLTLEPACGSKAAETVDNAPSCDRDSIDVFAVTFADGGSVFAESVAMTANRVIHLDLFKPWEQAHGPSDHVRRIARSSICRNAIPTTDATPASFCREARQVAVAFDYRHPLSNKILTNGFSFFVRTNGTPPPEFDKEAFGEIVRTGFQSGLSLWMTSLYDAKSRLPDALQTFLSGRTSSSPNGYTMFLPPQVIRLRCPQSATFVVELSFGDIDLFPRFPIAVARAKLEGRTIALNMNFKAFKCFGSELKFNAAKQLRFQLDDGCTNLIPVMAHELGHAFGLNHADDKSTHSLMDSLLSGDALTPTTRDVEAFANVLQQSIEGAEPGALRFVSSSGVQPPADWVPWDKRGLIQQ